MMIRLFDQMVPVVGGMYQHELKVIPQRPTLTRTLISVSAPAVASNIVFARSQGLCAECNLITRIVSLIINGS